MGDSVDCRYGYIYGCTKTFYRLRRRGYVMELIANNAVIIASVILLVAYILGACLGGNMTIIGAAANVIVSENSAKEGHPIQFLEFMKFGVPIVLISLLISSVYLYLKFLN